MSFMVEGSEGVPAEPTEPCKLGVAESPNTKSCWAEPTGASGDQTEEADVPSSLVVCRAGVPGYVRTLVL